MRRRTLIATAASAALAPFLAGCTRDDGSGDGGSDGDDGSGGGGAGAYGAVGPPGAKAETRAPRGAEPHQTAEND